MAAKAQRELPILRKLRKLRELQKNVIFVKFVAERKILKIVKLVAVFNTGYKEIVCWLGVPSKVSIWF